MNSTPVSLVGQIAVDTSVAVPLLVASHTQHRVVAAWARGKRLTLSGHALPETYAVLTRLPGDARVAPQDAARLIDERFEGAITMNAPTTTSLHSILANAGIGGGAVYDGLVALAAQENDIALATRDARARSTYEALGVTVEIIG